MSDGSSQHSRYAGRVPFQKELEEYSLVGSILAESESNYFQEETTTRGIGCKKEATTFGSVLFPSITQCKWGCLHCVNAIVFAYTV